MNLARRWWGPVDGTLHSFETLVDHSGLTVTRTGEKASCGWRPPGGVMEGQLDGKPPPNPLCRHCKTISYTRTCECCDGRGNIEVCINGHTGAACPCRSRVVDCPDCDGSGRENVSDEQAEAIEAGPGQ